MNVCQICIADLSIPVPGEHGIYRFREFGAARLVDATGVDPDIVKPMSACKLGAVAYLGVTWEEIVMLYHGLIKSRSRARGFYFLKGGLICQPCVREDGVAWHISNEDFKSESVCIQQPHYLFEGCWILLRRC